MFDFVLCLYRNTCAHVRDPKVKEKTKKQNQRAAFVYDWNWGDDINYLWLFVYIFMVNNTISCFCLWIIVKTVKIQQVLVVLNI